MNNSKKLVISFMLIFCLMILVAPIPQVYADTHSPILIEGNSQFTAGNGVTSGDGSEANPYIIEGWTISEARTSGTDAITILNTDAFFVIRNCTVYGCYEGIVLNNVTNGRVENNVISNTGNRGIIADGSFNTIIGNTVTGGVNGGAGMHVEGGSFNTFIGNTISHNDGVGIDLSGHNHTFIGNTVSDNDGSGIHIYDGNGYNCTFTDNTLSNNGISLSSSYFNVITGNTVSNSGIALSFCQYSILTNNTVSNNDGNGIYFFGCHNNVLTGNTLTNNSYGINLEISRNNVLSNNVASNNTSGGISLLLCEENTLIGNTVSYNSYGFILSSANNNTIMDCNIHDNTAYGVYNVPGSPLVNATYNWWGSSDGPSGVGPGSGDVVSADVLYYPWIPITAPEFPMDFERTIDFEGTIYRIHIRTNSTTVSSLAFDAALKQISFDVSGLPGVSGFCNVTIPANLLNACNFTLLVDGTTHAYTMRQNGTHSFLYFDYNSTTYAAQIARALPSFIVSSSVSVSTSSSSSANGGFTVNVTGTLRDMYGACVQNEAVALSFSRTGGTSWYSITSDMTGNQGSYFAAWNPLATGDYMIKAEWVGNATHSRTDNTVSLSSCASGGNVFSVESNTTIQDLTFDSQKQLLNFSASGPEGSSGYAKVTIAKSLVADINALKIKVDGADHNFTVDDVSGSWVLTLTYQHSAHSIVVDLVGGSPTEGGDWWIYAMVTVAAVALITGILVVARSRKTRKVIDQKSWTGRKPSWPTN